MKQPAIPLDHILVQLEIRKKPGTEKDVELNFGIRQDLPIGAQRELLNIAASAIVQYEKQLDSVAEH